MDFNVVQYTDWKNIVFLKTKNSWKRNLFIFTWLHRNLHYNYTRKIGEISFLGKFSLRHSLMLHWPQNNLYDKPHNLAVAYSSESELEKV